MMLCNKNRFKNIERIPMKIADIIERTYVARTFSIKGFFLNIPIIKSLEVLAAKAPPIFPLKVIKLGMIKINAGKVLKGKIKRVSNVPAIKPNMIETISDGNASLTIFPLVS